MSLNPFMSEIIAELLEVQIVEQSELVNIESSLVTAFSKYREFEKDIALDKIFRLMKRNEIDFIDLVIASSLTEVQKTEMINSIKSIDKKELIDDLTVIA